MFYLSMTGYAICMVTAIYYKWKKNSTEMIFWLFMALLTMLVTK